MNVSVIIVTRGDQERGIEDLILSSLPDDWEVLVWDNGQHALYRYPPPNAYWDVADLAVYGRYAAIEHATHDLIYVQDDDCVVSDPEAIVREWKRVWREGIQGKAGVLQFHVEAAGHVVCNMPQEFRHSFYEEHALVGFGAVFHRDAPARAFSRLWDGLGQLKPWLAEMARTTPTLERASKLAADPKNWPEHFLRTCDVAFTALTPRVLVDVPVENLSWASDDNRMWKQPEHVAERTRMLELVKGVRDAGS